LGRDHRDLDAQQSDFTFVSELAGATVFFAA